MRPKTILIFDDNETILDIFFIVLEGLGYKVEVSSVSHNILERVKEVNPSVIIMDNWIPDIGGVEATRLLKNHEEYKNMPVIYCSANSDIALLAEEAGADTYLSKPFDLEELEEKISSILA